MAMARATAWVSICPPFNNPTIPRRIRAALATTIAFVTAGTLDGVVGELQLGAFAIALLVQIVAGLALGFAVMLMFSAIQSAGELIDLQVGFALGQVLDPLSGSTASPVARFHQLLALVVLFAINGHVLVVRGFLRSVEAVPGGAVDLAELGSQLTELLMAFMVATVEIALPVLAALFCTDIALGLLGKAAPQMNVLLIGFAAKASVTLVLLSMTLVLLPEAADSLLGRAVRGIGEVFGG